MLGVSFAEAGMLNKKSCLAATLDMTKFDRIRDTDCYELCHTLGCLSTDIILKIDLKMARTTCLVCLVSTVSSGSKNTHQRGNASSGHITKLEQYTLLRYLYV